jgi:hypothetical protein
MTAQELWELYRDKVYGKVLPLSKTQEQECSRAFYAGMHAAFIGMMEISDSVSDEELASERVDEFRQSMVDAARGTEKWI